MTAAVFAGRFAGKVLVVTGAAQGIGRAVALRAAADADLAKARSEEAVVSAQLEQRRKEVAQLQNSLNTGEGGR